MTKKELRKRVESALKAIMKDRLLLKEDQVSSNDSWKHNETLQAYRDIFEAFKQEKVIKDYFLDTGHFDFLE